MIERYKIMNEILMLEAKLAEDVTLTSRERFRMRVSAVLDEFIYDYDHEPVTPVVGEKKDKTLYGELLSSIENANRKEIER